MSIRVLFVCMGNICRSPAAECIFRQRLEASGLAGCVECDSAGTLGYHAGSPPDERMQEELVRRKVPVQGRARIVTKKDLQEFDLILAMDRENLTNIRSLADDGESLDRVRLLCEFCTQFDADEVPDPYYGGTKGFRKTVDLIEDGCEGLLSEIKRRLEKE